MADLNRAEKLASAKKKLKQFQQKNKDAQSESGRSTPSRKKLEEEDGAVKILHSENGGSTYSLPQSESFSTNISGTESPVLALDMNTTNSLAQTFNGNSQPDILSVSNMFNTLPKVSESLFGNSSPNSFFAESPPVNAESGSDFFDNLPSRTEPPDGLSMRDVGQVSNSVLNVSAFHHPHVNASTPDGPMFQDTPNYSFPDASFSPINELKNDVSELVATNELDMKFKDSCIRNAELEQQLIDQKNEIVKLQSNLEDWRKKANEDATTIKHQSQAIQILVSEKTELQNTLEKQHEQFQHKSGEVEELQGRLRASRHRVSELERELSAARSQLATLESSLSQLQAHHSALTVQSDALGKRVGDLELEVSDLQNKVENRDQTVRMLREEIEEKASRLSLAELRIQQLSGGPERDRTVEDDLRRKNEELCKSVESLESQLHAAMAANEEAVKEYQRYVNRLHTELQELKTEHEVESERCRELVSREQQLVQQVSELERQLNRAPQPQEDPALQTLREQVRLAQQHSEALQAQLQEQSSEMECLREGLQDRALRIQELEVTIERLETDRPDSANLQAAIESDKVAASRAVAQNNKLKTQLEELQEALVKLSNSKLELTQQLQHEQHLSRELKEKLDKFQESKSLEVEKAQQTESPRLEESEAQTTYCHPVVSPEVMGKLEEKFRKTMSDLADLSDEKQRLEHLVLQLQSETETIGEYITLYQIQRGMLRQRAQEKDEQVAKLAQDKEALRNKLSQLNCLVQRLVGAGHHPQLNGYESDVANEVNEVAESVAVSIPQDPTADMETAEQIRSLLTEIGSNNLVTSAVENTNINFHPCPWCSGRLITV